MKLQIPYDGKLVEVDFPDDTVIIESKKPEIIYDALVRERILKSFQEYKKLIGDDTVTIIVNDATRRLPTSKILKILWEYLPTKSIEILIATGTHHAPSVGDLDIILGDLRGVFVDKIYSHDCYNYGCLVKLGETSRGTPVTINQKLYEAKNVICINSVEPHFFAGYTGGRKSLIPGLAGFGTIVQNHSNAKSEFAKSLSLDKNPVHLDLEEAVGFIKAKNIFSIQLVTSRSGEIVDIFPGDLQKTFKDACAKAHEVYAVDIERNYDIVFAVGEPPLDISLYQMQKAQEHGAEAVAEGGILAVVGACNEGAGSPYFVKLAEEYPNAEMAMSDKAMSDNRFGIHKLVKSARRLLNQHIKLWYVTKVDDNTVRKVYYEPKRTLNAALTEALDISVRNARVAILKDACFTVPVNISES
jgi:nickel-dependent lactate racemase